MNQSPYEGYPGAPQGQPGDTPQPPPAYYGEQPQYAPPPPEGYVQPAQYAQPAPYGYPPPFAIGEKYQDPRRKAATKMLNIMGLLVLAQTVASILFQMPITYLLIAADKTEIFSNELFYLWLSAALVPLSTALPFAMYLVIGKKNVGEYLRFERTGAVTAALCVLAGLSICLLANYPAFAVQSMLENVGYEPAMEAYIPTGSWAAFWVNIFYAAIVVPVMEEFAFRGVLLSSLRKYGTGFAIVTSGIIFGLVHLDFSNVVFATVCGLTMGFIYARTNNLWVTIAIHALVNGLAYIGEYSTLLFGENGNLTYSALMLTAVVVGLIALVVLLVARREMIFSRPAQRPGDLAPLSGGQGAAAMVRAPMMWVVLAMAAVYTGVLVFTS